MLFILFNFTIWGQERLVHSKSYPFTNSCALVQYADFPVSLYTGTPTIDIPIYTIDLGGYQLPVSLSYHASGTTKKLKASGRLGWTLNTGGAIMRTVEGEMTLKRGIIVIRKKYPRKGRYCK